MFTNVIDLDDLESYDQEEENRELIDNEEKKAKFRLLGPLGQGHNIVVHMRGSSSRIEYFKKLVGRIILIDNRTRWNS